MGEDQHDFLPDDRSKDEIVPATFGVESIDYAYRIDNDHTVIGVAGERIMIRTAFDYVLKAMGTVDLMK
jgi:hypothetical protein